MTFSEVLKNMMENRGYTAYRLAKEVGCSQTSVANWLNGQTPNPTLQRRVLAVLNGDTDIRETEKPTAVHDSGYEEVLKDVSKLLLLAVDLPHDTHRLLSFAIQELELKG